MQVEVESLISSAVERYKWEGDRIARYLKVCPILQTKPTDNTVSDKEQRRATSPQTATIQPTDGLLSSPQTGYYPAHRRATIQPTDGLLSSPQSCYFILGGKMTILKISKKRALL